MAGLQERLRGLQYAANAAGQAVIICLDGWDLAGKGELIKTLTQKLDPRIFRIHPESDPTPLEQRYHFLWRFQVASPNYGEMALFDRSWYGQVLSERAEKSISKQEWPEKLKQITDFERWLTDDGQTLLKFWVHVSKSEQKKRMRAAHRDPAVRWKLTKQVRRQHRNYKRWLALAEDMLARTQTPNAPWTVIAGTDTRWARTRFVETIVGALEEVLVKRVPSGRGRQRRPATRKSSTSLMRAATGAASGAPGERLRRRRMLETLDMNQKLSRKVYDQELPKEQLRLRDLEFQLYKKQVPVLCVFEGWDAAGKGGAIKRVTEMLDPRGFTVSSYAAPRGEEQTHHYLWRFWRNLPRAGHLSIFDRSYYGRVLVERVEGFATEAQWSRAYAEINEFEAHQHSFGMLICKFWLHITREEQLRRFKRRELDPFRSYKLTDEDWRNRDKWQAYVRAVEDMLLKTSTQWAPWTVIEANDKYYARVKVLNTIVSAVDARVN
jgi:polyphosphate:AMP phosphotransferase